MDDTDTLFLLAEDDEGIAEEDLEKLQAIASASVVLHGVLEVARLKTEWRHPSRHYLTHLALLPNPCLDTPWQRMFESQDDCAFITTMGFDVTTFNSILDSGFAMIWNTSSIPHNDVPGTSTPRISQQSLDAAGALGLVLHYLSGMMRKVSLQQIFALIPATTSRYITFALRILRSTLCTMKDAQIQWPTGDEFQELNALITARHPLLTGAFRSMDGLNLPVQESDDQETENSTYNGWLHKHFMSCVFAFSASGVVIGCRLNAPGSWHDACIAQPIYNKLRTETPDGYYLVTDTAFPHGTDRIQGRIRAPMKAKTLLPADPVLQGQALAIDRQLLSYRQTAEWGNRAIQGCFGRLRVLLDVTNTDLHTDILEDCICLYNLRTRRVGLNEIRSVYMPIWQADEQEQVWNHFETMLFADQRRNDCVLRFHTVATTL